jgi:hypothetical protein
MQKQNLLTRKVFAIKSTFLAYPNTHRGAMLLNRTVDAAGGADSLRAVLGGDLPIQMVRLPHGFWIQAGPAPQHGDLAQRDFIPAYRRVTRALHGLRIEGIDTLGKEFMSTAATSGSTPSMWSTTE